MKTKKQYDDSQLRANFLVMAFSVLGIGLAIIGTIYILSVALWKIWTN